MTDNTKALIFTRDREWYSKLHASPQLAHILKIQVRELNQLVPSLYDEMPHVILADLHASNVEAFEVCAQIKSDPILSHIPLIVLTDDSENEHLINCGAELYIDREESIKSLATHIEDFVEKTQHELDMHPLTRLPGNRSTVQRLESIIQEKSRFSIASIQIRNLGYIYKHFGHQKGDKLVRQTAEIIRKVHSKYTDKVEFVGHIGHHDFIGTIGLDEGTQFCEELIDEFDSLVCEFRKKSHQADWDFESTLSIAIVHNDKASFEHVSQVARASDQIHQYLKRFSQSVFLKDRRSNLRDPMLGMETANVEDKKELEKRVRKIERESRSSNLLSDVVHFLTTNTVQTYFQPIVSTGAGQIQAYEALSRFFKEDGTALEPLRIFQASRELDLIKEFDIMCALAAMNNAKKLPPNTKLFLNLNRETLLDHRFLARLWSESSWPMSRLVVEVTEQSLELQVDKLMESIVFLKKQGIDIALDDAGGGSVSLREAAKIRPDYLKIDQSLIREVSNISIKQKILESINVFARGINAYTVAEGIETKEDWEYVCKVGLTCGQGYWIAEPKKEPLGTLVLRT